MVLDASSYLENIPVPKLVTLPYNMLMQKSTREALGVLVKE